VNFLRLLATSPTRTVYVVRPVADRPGTGDAVRRGALRGTGGPRLRRSRPRVAICLLQPPLPEHLTPNVQCHWLQDAMGSEVRHVW